LKIGFEQEQIVVRAKEEAERQVREEEKKIKDEEEAKKREEDDKREKEDRKQMKRQAAETAVERLIRIFEEGLQRSRVGSPIKAVEKKVKVSEVKPVVVENRVYEVTVAEGRAGHKEESTVLGEVDSVKEKKTPQTSEVQEVDGHFFMCLIHQTLVKSSSLLLGVST
jgi:hypothetical protein